MVNDDKITAFVVNASDNVATALADISVGDTVRLLGDKIRLTVGQNGLPTGGTHDCTTEAADPGTSAGMADDTAGGIIESVISTDKVPKGHKIAVRPIVKGEDITKYGVRIGRSTADICAGSWVHLHNMESVYDERSGHLDLMTGAPTDIEYE